METEFDYMTPYEIGEFLWENNREEFNGKFFWVDNRRLYPIVERGVIVDWEFD